MIKQKAASISSSLQSVDENKIMAELETMIKEIENNKSGSLETMIVSQVYTLNSLFNFLVVKASVVDNDELLKTALKAQQQSVTAVKQLKQLKTPRKQIPKLNRKELIQRLGQNMSHNTYTALINSPEYIEAE